MKDSFRNNIVKLFSGSLLSQVVWMASMMLLVRIYQPENFSTYQMFISTINILAIFATARYENAIIAPKYRDIYTVYKCKWVKTALVGEFAIYLPPPIRNR